MATQFQYISNAPQGPGRHDALLDRHRTAEGWVKTRVIQDDGQYFRAVKLIRCAVMDARRVAHLDGEWYRLEESDFQTN